MGTEISIAGQDNQSNPFKGTVFLIEGIPGLVGIWRTLNEHGLPYEAGFITAPRTASPDEAFRNNRALSALIQHPRPGLTGPVNRVFGPVGTIAFSASNDYILGLQRAGHLAEAMRRLEIPEDIQQKILAP